LAFVTIILTYFLIVFGGYVASSESGMGCGPDWPLCNGEVIPELQGETLIEFGHRVIGAVLFLFTVLLFWSVKKEHKKKRPRVVANWMLGLLTLQLIMGAVVVFYHLPSIVVTAHLLIAMIYLAILIWFWRYPGKKNSVGKRINNHLTRIVLLLFITIGIGAYIKHQDYGLACGVIQCGSSIFPGSMPELLQTVHRLLAAAAALYILFFTYMVFRKGIGQLKLRIFLACVVVLIQLLIGVFTIVTFISITFAVWHLAAATLLFAIAAESWIITSE
jgi:cytochrome c oxidase assembly protein subunit 15